MDTNSLYKSQIIDHYKHPKNWGNPLQMKLHKKVQNVSCGDELEIGLEIVDGVIKNVIFNGSGCAISVASMSLLSEQLKGKTLAEVKKIKVEDILKNVGMAKESPRIKCALLSYEGLKELLASEN
jgi:nitrogen fixation NifU-like protein